MKIAFIVRHLNKAGGISRYVAECAAAYSIDHEVHVFTSSCDVHMGEKVKIHILPILTFKILSNLKLHSVNVLIEKFIFMIVSNIMVNVRDFDIVHNQGDFVGQADIYTAHSCHRGWLSKYATKQACLMEKIRKSPLNPLHMILLYIEKSSVYSSRIIISISEQVKRELLSHYSIESEKIVVIPNGVNIDEFMPIINSSSGRAIREKYGIGIDEISIIFPAHEYHRKGLAQLIKAVSNIKEQKIKVLVVGRDNPKFFQKLSVKLGCFDRIKYFGHTNDISSFFQASDMLVFPTFYEPFGLIITEAMASGIPVVVSRCAGAAELISDGVDGLLIGDPDNIDEIRTLILQLINDSDLRRSMGNAGRLTILKYSWPIIANMTMNVYHSVFKNKYNSIRH